MQHLAALARLYIQRSAYQQAAAVYEVLAKRRGGSLPEEVVSLDERLEYFQSAVLQVRPQRHTGQCMSPGVRELPTSGCAVPEFQQRNTADALHSQQQTWQ